MIETKHIVEKVAELFKTSGIRTNTMDDIAGAIGISKKTLYQHVKDKNELIDEVIEHQFQKIRSELNRIASSSSNAIEELIKYNALIINFLKGINPVAIADLQKLYQDIYKKWKTVFKNMFSESILQSIRAGKKSLLFRDDINEELITGIHTDKIELLQQKSSFWGANAESPELIKEMVTYYIRGMITKQGEIILNKHITDFNKLLNTNHDGQD